MLNLNQSTSSSLGMKLATVSSVI